MTINVTGMAFFGTHGADNLQGASWDDGFYMTADNYVTDTVNGGGGNDTVNYSASSVGVEITLTDATTPGGATGGTVEADFPMSLYNPTTGTYYQFDHHQLVANLTSIENATGSSYDDTLIGNSGNNVLSGGAGNDIINGGAGNDRIIGGAGHDTMTGGSGNDTFVFSHASDGPMNAATIYDLDTVKDFVRGEDKLDFSGLVAETAGHHDMSFIGGGAFTGVAGQISSVFDGYGFLVQADLDGDKHADLQVLVSSSTLIEMHNPLSVSDFILH